MLPGCKFIGRGAVSGAGAVVTRNVERYTIVAGNPARKLRDRFSPELIEAIEASKWWELNLPALRRLAQERPDMLFNPDVVAIKQWQRSEERRVGNGCVRPCSSRVLTDH